jgi:pimeloyl-ACP methyl ester carboxylesterase
MLAAAVDTDARADIEEHTGQLGDIPVFWRDAPHDGTPIVWVHGVPMSSYLWLPFLSRCGGVAPDLPGFGRSAKRADLDYSIEGYRRFLADFLDHVGVGRLRLVVHDWGAVGLALAQAEPDRIERLVIINSVPFLPGYRWHWVARIWRRRVAGELAMGSSTRWGLRLLSRQATASGQPLPEDLLDSVWEAFDQGTQRAILRLYRGSPPDVLAQAGRHLDRIDAPTLVVWGESDRFLPTRFAEAYAARLPNARLHRVRDAGHCPWIDQPGLVEDICAFLARDDGQSPGGH